ncbi:MULTISPECIES: CAP domain-containing protein [Mycobacteriaceae]|jgi:uncharacterized protein YkwD|uniref:CAP domain-containing protein n=1 Tax=Mycolicibacterium parafortuitum TaxID=39692 RepID=A0ACC6MPX3_MYCPF|nr:MULTISPECIES: CAP domain-containing protein [Mycobacteriaceae]MDZ5089058.1 CAP domain-containing protein [Mycolicibacterium parafortuitum]
MKLLTSNSMHEKRPCRDKFDASVPTPRRVKTVKKGSASGLLPRLTLGIVAVLGVQALLIPPAAHGDNKRLNDGVVANVYTIQRQAGCPNDIIISPTLQLAAQWHARDALANRNVDGDIGSDGSTPQVRAEAAGFSGVVSETVAINPALALSGIELINQWYYDPVDFAVMSDCANTRIGVWSENSIDRTVVVAVYGKPQ